MSEPFKSSDSSVTKATTATGAVLAFVRGQVGDKLFSLGLVVAFAAWGYRAFAAEAADAGAKAAAPLATEVEIVKGTVTEQGKDIAEMKRELGRVKDAQNEMKADVKWLDKKIDLLLENRGIKVPAQDGGR